MVGVCASVMDWNVSHEAYVCILTCNKFPNQISHVIYNVSRHEGLAAF